MDIKYTHLHLDDQATNGWYVILSYHGVRDVDDVGWNSMTDKCMDSLFFLGNTVLHEYLMGGHKRLFRVSEMVYVG